MATQPLAAITRFMTAYRSGLKPTTRIWRSRLPAVHWGRHPSRIQGPAIILFPCYINRLCCGLAGIIAVKGRAAEHASIDLHERLAASFRVHANELIRFAFHNFDDRTALPFLAAALAPQAHLDDIPGCRVARFA